MDTDILQSTLDDLSHLLIPPSQITLENSGEIGVGGYGQVFLAIMRSSGSQTKVAVKQLRIVQAIEVRRRIAFRLARELKVWATAKHPNILALLGFYLSDDYLCAQIVSEYMANGNVKEYINKFKPDLATRLGFVQGITSGMSYLHNCVPAICHGDLKPTNVLVNESVDAVLCDFGLATFILESGVPSGLTTSKSVKGSTRYMAPELLLEAEAKHTLESDVWAWACTTFEVLTDFQPFHDVKMGVIVMGIIVQGRAPGSVDLLDSLGSGGYHDIADRLTLNSLKSIIPHCWIKNPTQRPSLSVILNRLISPDGTEASDADPAIETEAVRMQKGYGEGAILIKGHESEVVSCKWNPLKRDVLATGSANYEVRLWNVPVPPAPLLDPVALEHHLDSAGDCYIEIMEWDCTGARLATGCCHGVLQVWTAEGALQSDLKFHTGGIHSIIWSPSALLLLSASVDGTVVVWDMRTQKRNKIHQVFEFHNESVLDAIWFDDETLISCGDDEQIHICRLLKETPLRTLTGHEKGVRFLGLSKDKTLLASSSFDLTIRIWNMDAVDLEASAPVQSPAGQTDPAQMWVLRGRTEEFASLGWCPSLNPAMQYLLVSTSLEGTSTIWDAQNGSCIKELLDHRAGVPTQAFSPRGRYLATGSDDGRILIYSSATGTLLCEWDCQSGIISDIQWQSTGDQLAVCLGEEGVAILDTNKMGLDDYIVP